MIFNIKNIVGFENVNFNWTFFWKRKPEWTKENINILFIDNESFPVVENLVSAGWSAKRIRDVKNIQEEDVKRSQIIFVDYKGVGNKLSEKEEGIGVIKAIKQTYGDSKRVILYSAYGRFSLGPHLDIADNQLSKESDTYKFITMIEAEIKKIK